MSKDITWVELPTANIPSFVISMVRFELTHLYTHSQVKAVLHILACVDKILQENKQLSTTIGSYIRHIIDTKHDSCFDHTKKITISDNTLDEMFTFTGTRVSVPDTVKSFLVHFVHANANNLILLQTCCMSLLHSCNPSIYPADSIKLLTKMYFLMRSHVDGDIMENVINTTLDEFNDNVSLTDDKNAGGGWKENFLFGFYKEMKCITHKLSRAVYKTFIYTIKKPT